MLIAINYFNVFKYGVSGILLYIDSIVYWLISVLFNLFESLAKFSFSQGAYQEIANRFYVVIGVAMLFYIAYALLKAIINPDELNKSTKKIAINTIVSLILLALVPVLFSTAFKIQNIIIDDNVVGNLIFGRDNEGTISNIGREVALTTLQAFLVIDDNTSSNGYTWGEIKGYIREYDGSDFKLITEMAEAVHNGTNNTRYTGLVSTACGLFLAYVMICFCLDLGIRVVKLVFYQVLAPIPILLRIIPEKKSVFDNYVKKVGATFFEVFVQIFVIYVTCFLVTLIINYGGEILLPSKTNNANLVMNLQNEVSEVKKTPVKGLLINDKSEKISRLENNNYQVEFLAEETTNAGRERGDDLSLIAKVIIILGVFAFAKQAPKLISDITGINSGNIKLGISSRLKNAGPLGNLINNVGQRTLGAVTGGVGAASLGLINGAGLSSIGYGLVNGWKGKGMQFGKQRNKFYNDIMERSGKPGLLGGKPFSDKISEKAKNSTNNAYKEKVENRVERFENSSSWINEFNSNYAKEHQNKEDYIANLENQYQQAKNQYQADANRKITSLQQQQHHAEEVFEAQRGDRIMAERQRYINDKKAFEETQRQEIENLKKQFDDEQARFNALKEEKIKELSMKVTNSQNNYNERVQAKNEIDRLKNTQYENHDLQERISEAENKKFDEASYQNRLQEIKNEKFDASRFISQINDLRKEYHNEALESSLNEARKELNDFELAFNRGNRDAEELASVREATVKTMRKENAKYKANTDYVTKKAQEKATKEYMESQEGKNQIAAWQKAMENYGKSNNSPVIPAKNDKDKK